MLASNKQTCCDSTDNGIFPNKHQMTCSDFANWCTCCTLQNTTDPACNACLAGLSWTGFGGTYTYLLLSPESKCTWCADGQEEVASADHKKRKRRGRTSSQVKVDKERLMTSTEAAATNEKLPKGFMYVPAHRLNSTPGANEWYISVLMYDGQHERLLRFRYGCNWKP